MITTVKIAPVTVRTKRDRSKIDWAGVDTGAKILVGLRNGSRGAANVAIASPQMPITALSARTYINQPAEETKGASAPCLGFSDSCKFDSKATPGCSGSNERV